MKNKTCIITGASRGIGLATALRFARRGANVVAVAREPETLHKAAAAIEKAGAACLPLAADVSRPERARGIIADAQRRFGRVDVLVNNAGCAPLAPLVETTPADFDRVVALNMAAIFHTTQAVWPAMRQAGGGVIVNISSMASVDPFPGFSVYGASKAWVNVFTKAVADEGRSCGIRVYAVAPGAVETKLLRAAFPDLPPEDVLAPDAVAAVIEALCDDRMAAASGQTVFVRK